MGEHLVCFSQPAIRRLAQRSIVELKQRGSRLAPAGCACWPVRSPR